jgi:hypothetical protein
MADKMKAAKRHFNKTCVMNEFDDVLKENLISDV